MQSADLLDSLPLWDLYVATIVITLLAVEGGQRLGKYRRQRPEPELEAPVGVKFGVTLGLLAFMLAFTFGLAASLFGRREALSWMRPTHWNNLLACRAACRTQSYGGP